MDKKHQGKFLTLRETDISSQRSVSQLSLLARTGTVLGVAAAAIVAGTTVAAAQRCTDADVGKGRFDPVGRGVRCAPNRGTAARQKAAREKAERERAGQEQRAEEQRAKQRAEQRALEDERAKLRAEQQQLREAQQRMAEEQQRAKLRAEEQALREAQKQLADERARLKLTADELLRRERGAPPPPSAAPPPVASRVAPPSGAGPSASNRLGTAISTYATLFTEFARLDVLAQEWTGSSSIDRVLERAGWGRGTGGAITTGVDILSSATTTAEAITRIEEVGPRGVFDAFGEERLETNRTEIDAATEQLAREGRELPDWPCIDSSLADLLLPAQRQQYRDDSRPVIPQLERLQRTYDQRAAELRRVSDEAKEKGEKAFKSARFLDDNTLELGAARGLLFNWSAEAAGIFSRARQLESIGGSFDTYAKEAKNLAARYAEQSTKARDCAGYLRRL